MCSGPKPNHKMIETKEEGDDPRWYTATTFSELIALNKEFIQGKLKTTPYHGGPLETDDKEFIGKLLQLHDYGLLSDNGQDTVCTYGGYTKEGVTSTMGKHKPAYYWDEERRGYLVFFVDLLENGILAESLVNQIINSNLVYSIYNFHTKEHTTNIKGEKFNLTRNRAALTKEALQKTKWRYHTNIPAILKPTHLLWNIENPILEHSIHFDVVLPEYGKGDLESMLIDMCKTVQNVKKYK